MRVLIDGLTARVGGGVTYLTHILPELAENYAAHEFYVLLSPQYQSSLIERLPSNVCYVPAELPARQLGVRFWFQQSVLPRLLQEHEIDVFFAPAESAYFRIPVPFVMLSRNASIYAPLRHFGQRRWRMLAYRVTRQPLVSATLRRADRVVFVSETFREQVVAQARLAQSKTRVIHHGVSSIFCNESNTATQGLRDQPYFLTVSTINPHKNFAAMLKSYHQLPPDAPDLLIAGGVQDEATFAGLAALAAQLELMGRVRFLGRVPYEDLPALYQGALALVLPSRLETFGHPLVEAMASGTPVLASDLPICREICRDAALFFAPDDVAGLAQLMRRVIDDGQLRDELRRKGRRRAQDFSWKTNAEQLVAVFEELL